MTGARSWGFRARLTALIAGVFILGGAVLLSVQYILVQQVLTSSIRAIIGCASDAPVAIDIAPETPTDSVDVFCRGDEVSVSRAAGPDVWIEETGYLSDEVLRSMLLWSIVTLVVFAGVAVLAARWLSQRSLGRIAEITRATREITRDDLHRRLALPGPADEVKELGDTIDEMLDRLNDAFTRQERFVAAASHELRTPLTTTRAALEIPLEQGRFPVEVVPEVRRALAANQRSERLIATLLTLARSTHAAAVAERGKVDLAALTREALDQFETLAHERGIVVAVDGGATVVAADETLTSIAVGNLLENAILHNRVGGAVRITIAQGTGRTELVIENDGHRLTKTETAHLIEPFHRGAQTRLADAGTGLGLTLADATARSVGATLTLAPRHGGGLIARLSFPTPTER